MYAVATQDYNLYGASVGAGVYGLFANDDGNSLNWQTLGVIVNQHATAVSSYDGANVLVGTDQGNIYRLDAPYVGGPLGGGIPVQLAINPGNVQGNPQIDAILELSPALAFASYESASKGYVLAWQGQAWNPLGGGLPNTLPFTAFEAPDVLSIFAGTRTTVYVTHDLGNSWFTASDGLPTVAQGTDLHYVREPDGNRYLYLATYGWSLWRTLLP
jgi:hypothetical protein